MGVDGVVDGSVKDHLSWVMLIVIWLILKIYC